MLVAERRSTTNRSRELQERADELDLTLQRFAKLQAVYVSDLQRLQSIEEGGYVLVAMAGMDCPVCGAPPGAQKHNHASEEISMAHRAAAAEARKIEREQRELAHVITSLEAEAGGLRRTITMLTTDTETLDASIQMARPQEATLRESYETYSSKRVKLSKVLDLYQRRAKLVTRRTEIDAVPTKREGESAPVGPNSTTVFKFGETVKAVLTSWHFPNADKSSSMDRPTTSPLLAKAVPPMARASGRCSMLPLTSSSSSTASRTNCRTRVFWSSTLRCSPIANR